ncbi:DNA repair protein RecN [Corallococcus exiguus]|uniref:DNA repair protein RecN n=1 Tax=Corallococcus exiguus TaxID=83462 RepID=A0A7X5BQB5_9BACT|nr:MULTISPECIES: DNA repair protein RecN [Corallococcus]NBC41761.1 DNA repair protein RecN [Corallococcus exiguus]NNC20758.1 DNA repair protein RecN [Corallococcus exiguus]NRD54952.1 DNA repair protein RecN [Corallococcus exiguus]NRD68294.1 DNA repair protein RecN [Corallococcus exiguus]RKH19098.1 DNA repair protein RecN [Corallococcus sp. CA041A]
MLLGLRISNVAVIEEVEVAFGAGLTVLTGETGAGKSILVDALGLLLGGRADADVIRAGCEDAAVEGVFARTPVLAARLEELGLPDLGEEVLVRRVLGRTGRGKVYVNGALVTLGVLGKLTRGAVDIAGQHEHVSLFDSGLHRVLLDKYGRLEEALAAYGREWANLREVDGRMDALGGDDAKVRERAEFLRFQLDEITRLDPETGEDVKLDAERRRLGSAQKLKRQGAEAELLVSGEAPSAVEIVGRALGLVHEGVKCDATLAPVAQSLSTALSELEEAARLLNRYVEGLESDPGRLGEVEERLDALKRLCRKHGATLDGVLKKRGELETELGTLENRREILEELNQERKRVEERARKAALTLSRARKASAGAFSQQVREGLGGLAMGKAAFEVRVTAGESLRPDGMDEVEFFFSANPGEPARPLAKVASGGEASRLLLALKRALADSDACGCYILDEADAGVSGAIADVVGRMIREVSSHRQVLCITHLPQVAAYADAHLLIRKSVKGERTVSQVLSLSAGAERTQELARMMSGVEVTREALGAAEALVRSAHRATPRARRESGPEGNSPRGRLRRTA